MTSQNNKLVCMRGCPGSGKSYQAEQIAKEHGKDAKIRSTDHYFTWGNEYRYDPSKVAYYHSRNQRAATYDMMGGVPTVIIDNTNIRAEHFLPYYEQAKKYGYDVDVVEPNSPCAFDAEELARRNSHGVPLKNIQGMLKQYQPHDEFVKELEELWQQKQNKTPQEASHIVSTIGSNS